MMFYLKIEQLITENIVRRSLDLHLHVVLFLNIEQAITTTHGIALVCISHRLFYLEIEQVMNRNISEIEQTTTR